MMVTIFTPTYNRVQTLPRVYQALLRQTDKRFEWLIVDDGSTDHTRQLIQTYSEVTDAFPIRYYYQDHVGKPRAQNMAVDLAKGDLFITCDSNKFLSDNAIELIIKMADGIENTPMMCGVGGYRADFSGQVYGGEMRIGDADYLDCTRLEAPKYHITGDKASAFFTDILRKYKSPVFPGEVFVSESAWLLPMALDGYRTRWFPEILVYGEYSADGLTKQGANSFSGHQQNFFGYLYCVRLEIIAHGISNVLPMVHEAIDIANTKNMRLGELAKHLGCTIARIICIQISRSFHSIYGKVSNRIKLLLGERLTQKIQSMKYRTNNK